MGEPLSAVQFEAHQFQRAEKVGTLEQTVVAGKHLPELYVEESGVEYGVDEVGYLCLPVIVVNDYVVKAGREKLPM